MKIDIVIPTLGRLDKLVHCLNLMHEQLLTDMTIHVYFSLYEELLEFRDIYETRPWLRYHLYAKSSLEFNMTEFWHKHIQVMDADVMGYFVNDQLIQSQCFRTAAREFETAFPDYDGILGIGTIYQRATSQFGRKFKAGDILPHVGCALIGRPFASRFPHYQFFCPDYWHLYPARELLKTATTWKRVKLSRKACVVHDQSPWNGLEPDEVQLDLRARFRDTDHAMYIARKERDYCWGLDFNLLTEGLPV